MPDANDPGDLLQCIPEFLRRVADLESYSQAGVANALAAANLHLEDDRGHGKHLRSGQLNVADPVSFERRLRSAITRVLGKPSGTDKHWDAGCVTVTAGYRRQCIQLSLRPQLSMTRLRAIAAAWLGGTELRQWLAESGFVSADSEPTADGRWPKSETDLARASVWTSADRPAYVHFYVEPGVRPPGATKSANDDERFDQTLEFLADLLGDSDRPGWWHRGSRSFAIQRMRSYTRSVTFREAPAGKVSGPNGDISTIPTSPDPDPAAAVALLRTLALLRGLSHEETVTALAAGAAITEAPERRRNNTVTVTSAAGQPVDLVLIDGRFARGVVQVTRATKNTDVNLPGFAEAFGEAKSYGSAITWRLGPMVIGYAGCTGDDGFDRVHAYIAEDTSDAVDTARSWLLNGSPLREVRVRDAWQRRCVGAAISAEVVPAVTAGQPVWRVDDRLLWLQEDQLVGADAGSWPAWATGMPPGGVSLPASPEELAGYLDAVAGWRDVHLGGAIASLVDLGWASNDPDAVTRPSDNHAIIRLRRPAGSGLRMTLRDNHIQQWTIELAKSKDPSIVTPVEQRIRQLLNRHAVDDRGGWRVGAFRVHIPGGVRADGGMTLDLRGSRESEG